MPLVPRSHSPAAGGPRARGKASARRTAYATPRAAAGLAGAPAFHTGPPGVSPLNDCLLPAVYTRIGKKEVGQAGGRAVRWASTAASRQARCWPEPTARARLVRIDKGRRPGYPVGKRPQLAHLPIYQQRCGLPALPPELADHSQSSVVLCVHAAGRPWGHPLLDTVVAAVAQIMSPYARASRCPLAAARRVLCGVARLPSSGSRLDAPPIANRQHEEGR
jgi:hypothetical protein